MLRTLTIESFKSLENVEIELGQINFLIGANGSGKSNILEAAGVLGAAASGRVDDESLLRRGVRPGVPQLYKSAFPHKPTENKSHIFFGAATDNAKYEVSLWNPLNDPKPAWRFKAETLVSGEEKLVGRHPVKKQQLNTGQFLNPEQGFAALKIVESPPENPAAQLLSDLRNYAIYCANTPTLRGLCSDNQTREPLGLSGGRLAEAVLELLRARLAPNAEWLTASIMEAKGLIDWAKSIGSAPSAKIPLSPSAATAKQVVRFRDKFMIEKRSLLSGYDASEGALYILFGAVLALHPKSPRFFAIDNIDQALNPILARNLATALCRWTIEGPVPHQLLITAHNPAVLDGLPLQDGRVRLFTVQRTNRGHTAVRRVEVNDEMRAKAAEGWTLSRMWLNGLIGGVPDV